MITTRLVKREKKLKKIEGTKYADNIDMPVTNYLRQHMVIVWRI